MSNKVLNSLLKEYEQKKLKAEIELDKRKELLYNQVPKFKKIEDDLNHFAIITAKNILNSSSSSYKELQEKVHLLKEEKNEILKSMNLPDNYLKPFYECEFCKDTGYIKENNYRTIMCNCLKQKLLNDSFHKSNLSNLESENFNKFNELIFSNEINSSKYKLNISPRNNIINIKNKCIEFVNRFDDINQKNLLFTGNTGLR